MQSGTGRTWPPPNRRRMTFSDHFPEFRHPAPRIWTRRELLMAALIVRQLTLLLSGELSVAAATCKDYLQVQRATIVGLKGK